MSLEVDPLAEQLRTQFLDTHERVRRAVTETTLEALNWRPSEETNSIAVLVTHLVESEGRILGIVLLGQQRAPEELAATRQRSFAATAESHDRLLRLLDDADGTATEALARWETADHGAGHEIIGVRGSVAWWVLRSLKHGAEHLGQIELTRQWWAERRAG